MSSVPPSAHTDPIGWRFDNTYARLPAEFFARVAPAPVRAPRVVFVNSPLAVELGLNLQASAESTLAPIFAGQELPPGAEPIAQAYAGHQFGGFTMLGDGRAILLGEHRAPNGQLVDLQFKGSGRTPFSRGGDGRAALGPMLREALIGEAMHALGIPTTRALAVVSTGEKVQRETLLPGAILTRVAASHLRVGTFQYAAASGTESHIRTLADYALARHDPGLIDQPEPYLPLLRAVIDRQAALIARWQLVGFVHGVMNTDNMTISGETIDYGPCAFLDTYHPEMVFSSIDTGGRYAFGNQSEIALWNLCRFAETLLPLIDPAPERAIERATELLREFPTLFESYWLDGMRRKLGLFTSEEGDRELAQGLLAEMQGAGADFTNTFRGLSAALEPAGTIPQDARLRHWQERWQERLNRQPQSATEVVTLMKSVNPAVIPRNQRVEEALQAAEQDDLSPFQELLAVITRPFAENVPGKFTDPPPPGCPRYRTFCGT